MTLTAAADGSALGNPGPAGWAWVIDDARWRAGGWPRATNNQGELMAVLDLLRSTADVDEPLRILCDSQYVINSVTKWMPGWKRRGWRKADGKPVLNRELLEELDQALAGRNVTFEWVKGHAGHPLNERADDLARAAAQAFQGGREPNQGPGFGGAHAPGPSMPLAEAAPAEPTLFDVETARDPLAEVVENERSLMSPAVRGNRLLVGSLLHPEFQEIGASGKLWDRGEMIDALATDPSSDAAFVLIDAKKISEDFVQVLYRTIGTGSQAIRSSLWQLDNGAYRLRFHQGTIEGSHSREG